jgi:hypothetical protein
MHALRPTAETDLENPASLTTSPILVALLSFRKRPLAAVSKKRHVHPRRPQWSLPLQDATSPEILGSCVIVIAWRCRRADAQTRDRNAASI